MKQRNFEHSYIGGMIIDQKINEFRATMQEKNFSFCSRDEALLAGSMKFPMEVGPARKKERVIEFGNYIDKTALEIIHGIRKKGLDKHKVFKQFVKKQKLYKLNVMLTGLYRLAGIEPVLQFIEDELEKFENKNRG